jgi:hypothetical protein
MEMDTQIKVKNKGGRPKAAVKGEMVWVPAQIVAVVKAMVATVKASNTKGAKP